MQVGHQLVEAYAECMGLPLFRRRISGTSTRQVCGRCDRRPGILPPSLPHFPSPFFRPCICVMRTAHASLSHLHLPIHQSSPPPPPFPPPPQDLTYTTTQGDEVEDLAALLAYVQEAVPGVTAVTSGAIASDYQRLRVEAVCARLNLVSLAPLWHQPQRRLLRGMIESGIHAVMVKVRCGVGGGCVPSGPI